MKNLCKKTKISLSVVMSAVMIMGMMLTPTVASAGSTGAWVDGNYATGWCTYSSTDISGTTGYIANRTKSVKVYAYASYESYYFYYGSNSGSAYGSTVASAYVGIASPYTGIGAKAEHLVMGSSSTWSATSNTGYYE